MPHRLRSHLLPERQAIDQWGEAIQAMKNGSRRTSREREADPEQMARLLADVETARLKFAIAEAIRGSRSSPVTSLTMATPENPPSTGPQAV